MNVKVKIVCTGRPDSDKLLTEPCSYTLAQSNSSFYHIKQ